MSASRKAKRFLTAEQKYDLWVRMLTGQLTRADAAAEAGVDRLGHTIVGAGHRVGGDAGKNELGMSGPIPARVTGADKATLLDIIDGAVDAGWSATRACALLELDRRRAWRWQTRRHGGSLEDGPPGGNPIHGLLEWEEAEILAIFEQFADTDRSHGKLAHRGSYENRVWVSPSTVDRVLARNGLVSALSMPRTCSPMT